MHFSALSFLLLPSAVFAWSMKWNLENVANNWFNIIRPYVDMLEDIANDNNNDVTILMPSDSAVNEFVNSPTYGSITPQDIRQLFLYHTIRGNYKVENIAAQGPFLRTMLQQPGISGNQRLQVSSVRSGDGGDSQIYFYSGLGQNSSIWPGSTDLRASNGVTLQVIDSVLTIPMSMTETALSAGLTSFIGAVTTANINLDSEEDATYFIPTNQAFETVGSALNDASDDELQDILNYHYLNVGPPLYTSSISKAQWNTTEGENIRMSYNDDNSLFVNSAAVTQANILVANGVMHILDQVLNPNGSSRQPPAGSFGIPAFSNATRTSSPPFANAVVGAGDSSTTEIGPGPAETPLGSLAPGFQMQKQQIDESGAVSIRGLGDVYIGVLVGLTAVCTVVLL